MSLPIERLLDRIRTAESRHQRDIVMTVQEARDLHQAITRILLRLESAPVPTTDPNEIINVEVRGRPF